jgi:hypothetical protein
MNTISKGRPQGASRVTRGMGAAVVSTVLVVGLAGCMTGKVAANGPVVQRNAVAPAGIDLSVPADRIERQVAQQQALDRANGFRYAGRTADRVAEELDRGAAVSPITTQHFPTWTDRVLAQIEHDAAVPANPAQGMTADRLERFLQHAE